MTRIFFQQYYLYFSFGIFCSSVPVFENGNFFSVDPFAFVDRLILSIHLYIVDKQLP
jgi:hypothetical protein